MEKVIIGLLLLLVVLVVIGILMYQPEQRPSWQKWGDPISVEGGSASVENGWLVLEGRREVKVVVDCSEKLAKTSVLLVEVDTNMSIAMSIQYAPPKTEVMGKEFEFPLGKGRHKIRVELVSGAINKVVVNEAREGRFVSLYTLKGGDKPRIVIRIWSLWPFKVKVFVKPG